ncbi:hypothetical protein LENED_006645 [Lentinula edodes]|uniref:Uncharacterized protein n=1 Tax=Lentinula edodes TaxID=5353 RepID=A0A1Q3ECB3_LENED|nr:hypothetical protein LENED_006645 [Lentinula edodes]
MFGSPNQNRASSPDFASNMAGPSKGKQRAHPIALSRGQPRVTRAMSKSRAFPSTLDPAALNNIPEEDEHQDPNLPSSPPGPRNAGQSDGADLTPSLGHLDSPSRHLTERVGLPRLTIKLPGPLQANHRDMHHRYSNQTSPGRLASANPLRRLLSPVATSTPRVSQAGNTSMRIQDLLNSVPRYPAVVASSRPRNSDGHRGRPASRPEAEPSLHGRSLEDMAISRLLSGDVNRSRRASHSPAGAPPHNRQRTRSASRSPLAVASLLPAFQSPEQLPHDPRTVRRSNQAALSLGRPVSYASPYPDRSGRLRGREQSPAQHLARSRSPIPQYSRRHSRSRSPSRRRYRSRSRSPTDRRAGSSAVALPDPREQDPTLAVAQTVRILPEVISALRKGWPEHISLAYFNPKMVCSAPANRRRSDNTVSLSGSDLRIKSKDLSHFDLARVSTDDFGEIAKTMPKALEAFLITDKSHGWTGSDHAMALADFVRKTFQMVTNRDDYLECFPAYLIYTEQVLFDWKNNPKQRGVPFVFNEPRWSRIERGVRSKSDWLLAYYTFESSHPPNGKNKANPSFRDSTSSTSSSSSSSQDIQCICGDGAHSSAQHVAKPTDIIRKDSNGRNWREKKENGEIICASFNRRNGCSRTVCRYKHICGNCGDTAHGAQHHVQ